MAGLRKRRDVRTMLVALVAPSLCCFHIAFAAPDEELLGKSKGYPTGTRANWLPGRFGPRRFVHESREAVSRSAPRLTQGRASIAAEEGGNRAGPEVSVSRTRQYPR